MTPVEAVIEAKRLGKVWMPTGRCSMFLNDSWYGTRPALHLSFYPSDRIYDAAFQVDADTFEELFALSAAKWAEIKAAHREATVRKMALKIIELTATDGECTDAALRMAFDPIDVEAFGAEAVASANEMAANGPFSIVTLARSNRAAA